MATSSNRQTYIRFYTDYPSTYFEKSEEIVEDSLSLDQTLIEGGLQFGVPCADKFECDLRNDFTVARKTTIWVYQIIDDDDEHPYGLFFGKVDSMKMDALGYITHLVAYDRFYFRRNKSVRKWWKKYWKAGDNDYTVKGIRDALLTKYGFRFDDVTLMNDNRIVYEPVEFKQLTFGELLTQLCAINACIPHIDSTGKICFIQLSNTVAHQLNSDLFELENCEIEYYDTPVIDGVSVENTDMVISSDEDDDEDADNVFAFPYNVFFEGKKEKSMKNRAIELYDAIKHITYRPCSIKMIQSDYSIKLGDRIRLTAYRNGQSITYNTFVFKNNFSGSLLIEQTFGCDGESEYTVSTGAGLASKVNASTEIVTMTITLTVEAATDDTISVSDEDGIVLYTTTFASGSDSATFDIDIPVGGQVLTFDSTLYGVSQDEFITESTTIVLEPDNVAFYMAGVLNKYYYTRNVAGSWKTSTMPESGANEAVYAFGAIYARCGSHIYKSEDKCRTWTQMSDLNLSPRIIRYCNNKVAVVGIYSSSIRIYLGSSADSWTRLNAFVSMVPSDIAYGAGTWVMVGDNQVGYSTRGVIAYTSNILSEYWDEATGIDSTRLWGVKWFGSFFLAWGVSSYVYKSTDGINWTKHQVTSVSGNIISMEKGAGRIKCTLLVGTSVRVYDSTDSSGTVWSEDYVTVDGTTYYSRGLLAFGSNGFAIARDDGTVQYTGAGSATFWELGTALPTADSISALSYVGTY